MNTKHIIFMYTMGLILVFLSFSGIRKVISKENLVRTTLFTVGDKEKLIESREFFNKIMRGLIIVFCVLVYVAYIIPAARDLPRVINNDFNTVEGVSVKERRYNDSKSRTSIEIEDYNGKKYKILCDYNEEIKVGDRFEIVYLPNFKIGSVKKHEKNTD